MGGLVHREESWSALRYELDVLARATGGAMLFGMPLMFTMEMWWLGEVATPSRVSMVLLMAFVMNLALARLGGFREQGRSFAGDLSQAVQALAVGTVLSTACLFALGRLSAEVPLAATLGTIAMQVLPLSLGASVANLVFTAKAGRAHSAGGGRSPAHQSPLRELLNDVGATLAGAAFVGFAIAPIDEIPMLAADLDGRHLFAVIALTMLTSYVIVFASGFDPSHHTAHDGGLFQSPVSETILSFTLSLGVALAMLLVFEQVSFEGPVHETMARVVALALPVSIGGAAGRVVV